MDGLTGLGAYFGTRGWLAIDDSRWIQEGDKGDRQTGRSPINPDVRVFRLQPRAGVPRPAWGPKPVPGIGRGGDGNRTSGLNQNVR